MSKEIYTKYRAGIGKLHHLVQNSQPDIVNAVRELSRQLVQPTATHYKAMISTVHYVKGTKNQGLLLNLFGKRDRINKDYKWMIQGHTNFNYATNPENQKSVSGTQEFLNGSLVMAKSLTQKL